MKRILLTNKYLGKTLKIVHESVPAGFEIQFLVEQTQESLLKQIKDVEYLLAGGRLNISETVLDNAHSLKMIQRSGVGLDAINLDAVKAKGIPLYVNQGVNAESVAEHTLLLMLACLRRLTTINQNTKNGLWNKQEQGIQTAELHGKTVGIIGMGNIARKLVSLLQAFQTKIIYNNVIRESEEFEKQNHMTYVDRRELYERADIITTHCALTPETRHLINSEAIKCMKDGAILINTARGAIVDTGALVDALESGKLAFAGIDVYEEEPILESSPLKGIENVILTPHIAGVTGDSFRAMMQSAFRNIELFEKGRLGEIQQYRYL